MAAIRAAPVLSWVPPVRSRERDDFVRLTKSFRGELLAHCYRMLGSVHDAEDQVQETYLRAWRSYDDFEGRSSLRSWLYRIATNACLTALESRSRRPLPSGLPGPAADDHDTPSAWTLSEGNALQAGSAGEPEHGDPAAIVASREHRISALLVAWERLSPRQRAVLILHDVLSWQATEIGKLLNTSDTAVHSMLRRVRAQLAHASPALEEPAKPLDPSRRELLDEYARAFETGDIAVLIRLLTDDVICEMTGSSVVLAGRADIARFLRHCPALGDCRMVPISVSGRPGFAVYRPDADGLSRAYSIEMLWVAESGIERIVVFEDRGLFTTLGLPHLYESTRAGPNRQAADRDRG